MRKVLITLLIASFVLSISIGLVACTPAKMGDILGTYKLVTDTSTAYQQETVDNIETYGRTAYLVVTGKDMGYYLYKDNDTEAYVREVKLEYSKNDENEVTSVTFITGEGEKQKSLHVDVKSKTMLVSRWNSATKLINAYNIEYERISEKTDLSTIKKDFGDVPVYGYNLFGYNGLYKAELYNSLNKNFSDYIYKYISIDSATCKATVYFALKSDKTAQVTRDLDVTFVCGEDSYIPHTIKIDTDEYIYYNGTPRKSVKVVVSGEEIDAYETLSYADPNEINEENLKRLIDEYEKSIQE